jgi:adrenodoxin-NADP+ reductase
LLQWQDAPGVLPARKFVWWYNGHPHGGDVHVDLAAVRSVAVLGLGNVALDCARLLLAPPQRLAPTDVAGRALSQLRQSAVRDVHLVARRSPAEVGASCSIFNTTVADGHAL